MKIIRIFFFFFLPVVLVLLIVTMRRRRKEPLILEDERDIRENIVRYDDEGGGEEDTEAFDMVALRNLNIIRDHKTRRDVTPETPTFFQQQKTSVSWGNTHSSHELMQAQKVNYSIIITI